MNKKIWWGLGIFGFFFLLGILLFAGYMYKYQQLVNEGSALADERCLTIDPIIAKKQLLALEYFKVFSSSSSAETKMAKVDEMEKYLKQTVTTSEPWLKKQKKFIDSEDFNFFTDEKIKDAFYAEYDKYVADLEANIAMINYFEKFEEPWYSTVAYNKVKAQDEMQTVLDEKLTELQKHFDIRWFFTKVPQSKCEELPNPFDRRNNSYGIKDNLG